MGDYNPQTEEEFYSLMKRKIEEVNLLDIPEFEKSRLCVLIGETIGRYEKIVEVRAEVGEYLESVKENLAKIAESYDRSIEAQERIKEGLANINNTAKDMKKELSTLDGTVKRIIAAKFVQGNPGMVN